jgi:hypothetical protein
MSYLPTPDNLLTEPDRCDECGGNNYTDGDVCHHCMEELRAEIRAEIRADLRDL